MATIYLMMNKLNGKYYVGQTWQKFRQRLNEHKSEIRLGKQNIPFHNAIRKYGWDNFVIDTIEVDTEDQNIINHCECRAIEYCNSLAPNGYNLREGGSKGKLSEITKQRMRDNHADFSGENHPLYGIGHTEETKKLMSELAIGKYSGDKNPAARSVAMSIKNNPEKEFGCIKDAAEYAGVNVSTLNRLLKGATKVGRLGIKIRYITEEEYEFI